MNCDAQGNVLIIQEDSVSFPEASFEGGMMFFEFKSEITVTSLGLMNIQGEESYITVVYRRGGIEVVERIDVVG